LTRGLRTGRLGNAEAHALHVGQGNGRPIQQRGNVRLLGMRRVRSDPEQGHDAD
jgi:hypothetical protein